MANLIEIGLMAVLVAGTEPSTAENDRHLVSQLDIAYQAAVKTNDAETMDQILHPEMILVRGDGGIMTRNMFIDAARTKNVIYDTQDEVPGTQTVRVWGDTAVVTALLHIVGTRDSEKFERRVWFSDTYVRTEQGWRYAFAQVSLPLSPT